MIAIDNNEDMLTDEQLMSNAVVNTMNVYNKITGTGLPNELQLILMVQNSWIDYIIDLWSHRNEAIEYIMNDDIYDNNMRIMINDLTISSSNAIFMELMCRDSYMITHENDAKLIIMFFTLSLIYDNEELYELYANKQKIDMLSVIDCIHDGYTSEYAIQNMLMDTYYR